MNDKPASVIASSVDDRLHHATKRWSELSIPSYQTSCV